MKKYLLIMLAVVGIFATSGALLSNAGENCGD